jgi:hypothetical protein
MASRFRKELTSVPAVRIRVGRQGLTTTIGWRGDTLGSAFTPVSSIRGRALGHIGDPRLSGPLPVDRFLIPGTRRDFGTGNVSDMTSHGLGRFKELLLATRQREKEIATDLTKAKGHLFVAWTTWALGWLSLASVIAKPIRRRTNNAVAIRRSDLEVLHGNLAATRISINFDMESEVAEPQRRMQTAFDRMAASAGVWMVQREQHIDRVKARSWAGRVVWRGPAILRRLAATLIDTRDLPLAISVLGGKSTAYFYPGFVLVDGGRKSDFALIDLTELNVISMSENFTETEAVPPDALFVGSTWTKANKDGSRDRRFKHNREVPILRYGSLHLSSVGGLNEALMFSNPQASASFAAAINDLKRILLQGRTSRRLENRPLLDRVR